MNMKKFTFALSLMNKPSAIFYRLGKRRLLNWVPDTIYVKISYKGRMGRPLNLKNPQRYTEKLQWLKLFDRNPLYTQLVDKYEVRNFLKIKGEDMHLVRLYGVYDSFDEINWDELPGSFIMKCTHGYGCNKIITDKDQIDIVSLRRTVEKWMKKNPYPVTREWPYKHVKHRIIIEELLDNAGELPVDYKFYCFNGNPFCCKVQYMRNGRKYQNYLDLNYQDLGVNDTVYSSHEQGPPERPEYFLEMIETAKQLSAGMKHVRIDFLGTPEDFYTGEFTFFTTSGYSQFTRDEFDFELGRQIHL